MKVALAVISTFILASLLSGCASRQSSAAPAHAACSLPAHKPADAPASSPPPQRPAPPPVAPGNIQQLQPIPGRPGIYQPVHGGAPIDLRGIPSGLEVRNPYTGETYIVP
ncbi:MAG: hypothetical protein J0I10_08745 [Verrucomicrobia bacterium]|nr:hypothetical protein [Verrucomicrobiota bacterium]